MRKKMLTLDDLIQYYSSFQRSTHYSCIGNNKSPIVVQTSGLLKFEGEGNDEEGLRRVRLQACHTEDNLNKSTISYETMERMLPSFKNRPILGYIHEVNGKKEFKGHEMHEDEEGNLVFDEVPVGIIPESNGITMEYDEEKDRYNVIVNGFLFEDYSPAVEILEREGQCSVSVEIVLRDYSFNAKQKLLVINDGYFSGVTILGKNNLGQVVKPGMEGSNIKLSDFAASKNSMFAMDDELSQQLIETLAKVNATLEKFNIEESKKGGNTVNKLDEMLAKYNVKLEDLDFQVDGLLDEELEVVFAEHFDGKKKQEGEPGGEPESEPESDDNEPEAQPEDDGEPEAQSEDDEAEPDTSDDSSTGDDGSDDGSADFEKFTKTFELSHDDIRCGLYALIAPYEEADNDFYLISEVYDDRFVYESFFGSKIWCQGYAKNDTDDTVALSGERTEMFRVLVTKEEKDELEEMKANYSELKEFKQNYELSTARQAKREALSNECYASISQKPEFTELTKDENLDKYSVEELTEKADSIIGKYARVGQFSYQGDNKKPFAGIMFSGNHSNEQKPSFLDGLLALAEGKKN